MAEDKSHPNDQFERMWKTVRRHAAAGSVGDAVVSLALVHAMLEGTAISESNPNPEGLPAWLVDDLCKILMQCIKHGTSLDKGFHLVPKRGRNLMKNVQRDMDIDTYYGMYGSFERLADVAEKLGLPPPGPGQVWTADALAKAVKAHERRKKSGLLFRGPDE